VYRTKSPHDTHRKHPRAESSAGHPQSARSYVVNFRHLDASSAAEVKILLKLTSDGVVLLDLWWTRIPVTDSTLASLVAFPTDVEKNTTEYRPNFVCPVSARAVL
jgi:hypothetical protein